MLSTSMRSSSPPGSSDMVGNNRHITTIEMRSSSSPSVPVGGSSDGGPIILDDEESPVKPLVNSGATAAAAAATAATNATGSTGNLPAGTDNKRVYSKSELGVVIIFYSSTSLAIVYFNWWLFTSSFEFPVFVSWVQQIVGVVLFLLFAALGKWVSFLSHFSCVIPNWRTAWRVLPLSFNFVLMVAFANLCLKYVQVSTYQVARSLTIFFTIVLSYGILGQTQSRRVIFACGVMIVGFIIGSLDPSTLSLGGVVTGACSSVFQAFYNVMIKTTLTHVNNDANVMLFYNQLISSFLFLPVVYFSGEIRGLRLELPLTLEDESFISVWMSLIFSGVLAALMNLAGYLCVKMTSPLTFNIVGFTKSLLQSLGGVVFLGDTVSTQSLGGISLSLCGSAWYSRVKMLESAAQHEGNNSKDIVMLETSIKRQGSGGEDVIRLAISSNPLMGSPGRVESGGDQQSTWERQLHHGTAGTGHDLEQPPGGTRGRGEFRKIAPLSITRPSEK